LSDQLALFELMVAVEAESQLSLFPHASPIAIRKLADPEPYG